MEITETVYRTSKYGRSAGTWVHLDAPLEGKALRFETSKGQGSLATSITCWEPTGLEGMLQFPLCGGFSRRVCTYPKRVTEKLVREQHERVLATLDDIIKEVVEFFTTPVKAAA